MVGQPPPRVAADPGETKRGVPDPPSILEWRPSPTNSRLPHRAGFLGANPFTARVEVRQPVALRHVQRGNRAGQRPVAVGAPRVLIRRSEIAVEGEPRRVGRLDARGLPAHQVQLRCWRGEPHRPLQYGNPAGVRFNVETHLGRVLQADLRARHRQNKRIVAHRAAREVRPAVIERQQSDVLPGREPRVVGDLAQRVRAQPPHAAIVQFDLHARIARRPQPRAFHQRKIPFRRDPGFRRPQLHFHLSPEFAQSGVAGIAGPGQRPHQ